MKVIFIHRDKREGNYSIEEIFNNLKNILKNTVKVSDYYAHPSSRLKSMLGIKKNGKAIYHITGDTYYMALAIPGRNTIITIHDLGHFEKTLSGFKRIIYKYFWLYLPIKRAKYITTISEFTRSKILEHFHVNPDKIKIIHNPISPIFKSSLKEFNTEKPRILQIGSGENKNVYRLIQAVSSIACKLILIRRESSELKILLEKNNIDYEWCTNLGYEQVYQKYIDCDMVYFASTYEGFGMPIIEANAVGRPIIAGNVASMPEIGSDAALFVDPYSVEDIRNAVLKLIDNSSLREQLIHNGKKNIQRFKSEEIANKYMTLYKEVYGEK